MLKKDENVFLWAYVSEIITQGEIGELGPSVC